MPTKIKLQHGDCLKLLAKIPANSVDVVVTSPPYNLGTKYSQYEDKLTDAKYLDFIFRVAQQIYRVLKPEGSFFLNVGGSPSKPHLPLRVAGILTGNLFKLQNQIFWVKSIAIGKRTHGHFTPINSPRYINNNVEFIYHLTKSGSVALDRLSIGVPYTDKTNIRRFNHKQDRRCRGNVWYIPYTTAQNSLDKFNHPAAFPVKLPMQCIRLHGVADPVVLDPFCGTGSTLVAARKLGAKQATGIDLDEAYITAARQRCQKPRKTTT